MPNNVKFVHFNFTVNGVRWLFAGMLLLSQMAGYSQGRIDLSTHDLNKPAGLSGKWEFYWNQLHSPEDFKSQNLQPKWIDVPGGWHYQNKYTLLGYGTYRTKVILPESQNLSILIPIINSSAKIWINGKLVDEIGVVADNEKDYEPRLTSSLLSVPSGNREIELIIQVANFTYFSSGMVSTPRIGNSSMLLRQFNEGRGVENFFVGSLIAMFIYQFILFSLYRKGKTYLYLGLICLAVALRAMVTHGGSFLLPDLFPELPWELWKKIEFFVVYATVALFPLYVYHLFPEAASRKVLYAFIGLAAFLCMAVLLTPQYTYGQLLDVCHLGLLLGFVYAGVAIYKALRARNPDAKIILLGILASFPFILAEILKNSFFVGLNITFKYLVEMGVLSFLLFQVYLLARHYAQSYRSLELMNRDLEERVKVRTQELTTVNRIKDKLLSVVTHDIKSPLNSLRGSLMIFRTGAVDGKEMKDLTGQVEDQLNQTTILVDNILLWTAGQMKGVRVNKEVFDLHVLIEEHTKLFYPAAKKKNITIGNDADSSLRTLADKNIVSLVLRNLLSNAIKFSREGGHIKIYTHKNGNSIDLKIMDGGVGMDSKKLATLFGNAAESTVGTDEEKGTGLGLILCREYLAAMGTSISATSEKDKGTTFSVELEVA